MARYGTNAADSLQAFSDGGEIFGWDAGNAVGDEGPADDNDTILGLSGHDLISGGNGDDLLNWGGSGDRFFGGSGDDTLIGLRAGTGEQVALYGGTGDDQFLLYLDTAPNPQGVIVVDGGDGIDLLSFGNIGLTTGVSLNIADLQGQYTRFPGMAITGIESRRASSTALCSMFGSMMNSAPGSPCMVRMPSRLRLILRFSRLRELCIFFE